MILATFGKGIWSPPGITFLLFTVLALVELHLEHPRGGYLQLLVDLGVDVLMEQHAELRVLLAQTIRLRDRVGSRRQCVTTNKKRFM